MITSFSSLLKKRVTVQELVKNADEKQVWRDKMTVFAQIKTIHDLRLLQGQVFHAMQMLNHNYVQFYLRYRPDIGPNMRIKYNNKIYDIKRITNHNEENRMLIIIGLETVNEC